MRIGLPYLAPLAGAIAVSAAIVVAPGAAADSGPAMIPSPQDCMPSGSGSICQSPGNAQFNDAPPPVQYRPYGGEAFLL
jgi:hypothetical protein